VKFGKVDVMINSLQQGSEKGIRCHMPGVGIKVTLFITLPIFTQVNKLQVSLFGYYQWFAIHTCLIEGENILEEDG